MNQRWRKPVISTNRKGVVLIILLLCLITTTLHDNPVSTAEPTTEGSRVRFNRIICTDTGFCLIFYHRSITRGDVREYNGPYVKAVYITPLGEITNPSPSLNLSMNTNVSWDIMYNDYLNIHEVQEEGDTLRLIGYHKGTLYEIWFFKNNNSLLVKDKSILEWWGYEIFHQWLYENQITNYTLVGLGGEDESLQLVKVDFHGVEKITFPGSYGRTNPNRHLYDGNNSFFLCYYDVPTISGIYNELIIRRLFLNGTISDYIEDDLAPTNRRWGSLLRSKDGNLYLGIRSYDPYWQDFSRKLYNHTVYLVNLASKQILSHSFTSQDSSYQWDVLIDSEGRYHVMLHTYFATQYLKFSPNGVLSIQSTLTFPETGMSHIPRGNFALSQNKYLIGGLYKENSDAGMFVVDVSTGKVVSVNASLMASTGYFRNTFIFYTLFDILLSTLGITQISIILLVLFILVKRTSSRVVHKIK